MFLAENRGNRTSRGIFKGERQRERGGGVEEFREEAESYGGRMSNRTG